MRMRCLFFPLCSAIALTSFVQAQSLERHPLYEPALVSAGTPGDAGNLFAGAKVTASGHYGSDRPELAVDGQTNNAGKYWGCEGIPRLAPNRYGKAPDAFLPACMALLGRRTHLQI